MTKKEAARTLVRAYARRTHSTPITRELCEARTLSGRYPAALAARPSTTAVYLAATRWSTP